MRQYVNLDADRNARADSKPHSQAGTVERNVVVNTEGAAGPESDCEQTLNCAVVGGSGTAAGRGGGVAAGGGGGGGSYLLRLAAGVAHQILGRVLDS